MVACAVVGLLVPPGAGAELELEPVGEFDRPIFVTSDPDDPDRLFVVERSGRIQLTEDGSTTPFLDIEPLVLSPPDEGANNDHGMFSLAFSPDHANDQLFYVAYSRANDPATVEDESGEWHIAEFKADGDVADPASRREVLTIEYPAAQLHYAGQLQFGPDGYLYASTGDGGPQGDPDGNAQDPGNLLGSILRIDPQGSVPGEYGIPADNPFVGEPAGADEVWSYGLRNPWRFSFDRDTGGLVIGDVGNLEFEEINYRPQSLGGGRGDNFGWSCREGLFEFAGAPEVCDGAGPFIDPVFAYGNSGQPGCAIIGGYVVRDPSLGDLYGRYLYGDLCTGHLRSIMLDGLSAQEDRFEGLDVPNWSLWSFGEDACGRLYVVSGPQVRRLIGESEPECDIAEPEEPPAEGPVVDLEPPGAPPDTATSDSEPPTTDAVPNNFRFVSVERMRRTGRARLVIRVPAAGTLRLLGSERVRGAGPRTVGEPSRVRLPIRPRGRASRKLNRVSRSRGWASVRVRARVRFAPAGGEPRMKARRVRLAKRR